MRNDVTLRQLRYFAALATELSYRRAAEKLTISQPALSAAIKQLEQHFGVALLTRSTHGVALTEPGQLWLGQVQEVLRHVDATIDSLQGMADSRSNRLRLGYFIGTGADLLFRVLRHFEATHPEMVVEAKEFDFSDPTAGLADGSSDVGLIRPPVDLDGHDALVLDVEGWVACLPRHHRYAHHAELRIVDLLDDPVICAPSSAGTWRRHWMAMDARGDHPLTIGAEAATYEEETTLVARGLGISFTSEASARLYNRQGVIYIPITDGPPSYTAIAWNPTTLTPSARALVDHVRDNWNLGGEHPAPIRPSLISSSESVIAPSDTGNSTFSKSGVSLTHEARQPTAIANTLDLETP